MKRVISFLQNELKQRNEFKKLHFIEGENTENWVAHDEASAEFATAISILNEKLVSEAKRVCDLCIHGDLPSNNEHCNTCGPDYYNFEQTSSEADGT